MCVYLVLDSFGKVPAGLNMGNHMSLGRFSDCNSIIVPRETHGGRAFEANYCRVTFRFPLPETAAQITRQCEGVNLVNAEILVEIFMLIGDGSYCHVSCSLETSSNPACRMKTLPE